MKKTNTPRIDLVAIASEVGGTVVTAAKPIIGPTTKVGDLFDIVLSGDSTTVNKMLAELKRHLCRLTEISPSVIDVEYDDLSNDAYLSLHCRGELSDDLPLLGFSLDTDSKKPLSVYVHQTGKEYVAATRSAVVLTVLPKLAEVFLRTAQKALETNDLVRLYKELM